MPHNVAWMSDGGVRTLPRTRAADTARKGGSIEEQSNAAPMMLLRPTAVSRTRWNSSMRAIIASNGDKQAAALDGPVMCETDHEPLTGCGRAVSSGSVAE
jgi:hypothetical protein